MGMIVPAMGIKHDHQDNRSTGLADALFTPVQQRPCVLEKTKGLGGPRRLTNTFPPSSERPGRLATEGH